MRPAYIQGLGFWSPGYANVEAWRQKRHDPAVTKPPCASVGSRLKRGTSTLTRVSVEVMDQAGEAAGFDRSKVPTVFGSAYGEMHIAIEQMDMMREGEGIVSPARFKNSVHNTAAGIFSIAHKNQGFTTAIAAGEHTPALTLLEAMVCLSLQPEDGQVLLSIADETLPEPLRSGLPYGNYEALGAAFALSAAPGDAPLGKLQNLAQGPCPEPNTPEPFLNNPASPALGLIDAVLSRQAGPVRMSHEVERGWTIDLSFQDD